MSDREARVEALSDPTGGEVTSLESSGDALRLTLRDGATLTIPASTLWQECPSAAGKVRRKQGRANPPPGLAIARVTPIGRYAVNIAFSDGHDRGIYPWSFLISLARNASSDRKPCVDDFIIPRAVA